MSQVASGFAVPSASLAEASRWAAAVNWKRFWDVLRPYEVGGDFAYSGYVVAVLADYLSEHEIEMPVADDSALAPLMKEAPPLLLAPRESVRAFRAALDRVNPPAEELARYWDQFCGGDEEADVGAAAMPAALAWLREVVSAAEAAEWCFVTVG